MKLIAITRGQVVIVDDDKFQWQSQWKWHARRNRPGGIWYAGRVDYTGGKKRLIFMHREILGLSDRNQHVDHINGDGLDNRRSNLRIATNAENNRNHRKPSNALTSLYKGVSWHKLSRKWQAQITFNGKKRYLGLFIDELAAARTYDKAAKELHGEFARLNWYYLPNRDLQQIAERKQGSQVRTLMVENGSEP